MKREKSTRDDQMVRLFDQLSGAPVQSEGVGHHDFTASGITESGLLLLSEIAAVQVSYRYIRRKQLLPYIPDRGRKPPSVAGDQFNLRVRHRQAPPEDGQDPLSCGAHSR